MDHPPPVAGPSVNGLLSPTAGVGSEPEFVGALDLGTNNCRLMIAAPTAGGFRVVDSFTRTVRLGEGLHHTGRLSDDAMDRTVEALQICADRLARRKVGMFQAVATEACRRAVNGQAFVERAQAVSGFDIHIISGREEASLAVESCANLIHNNRFGPPRGRALLFDIGGGSTEIAWIRTEPTLQTESLIGYLSLPVGVVTLSEQFGPMEDLTPARYRAMVDYTRTFLHEFESVHRIRSEIRRNHVRLIGTSGTVTTLASLILNLPRYARAAVDGSLLPASSARLAMRKLQHMGLANIENHPCIGPDRAPFVLPGCAIFEAIHDIWPMQDIIVADRGLRDGMILRMLRKATSTSRRSTRPQHVRQALSTQNLMQATGL
ncbi:Ppx/GppA family phosphatase [Acetobacter lambici]|uniref:Ppx/GppA family phosphatase n=1 Tax=Acetobacter lambici TaxID=1332824 RepID=A0ABT1F2E8_9PROT|nr:Ppx/GppA phosphatase family protein [Acetobacter lambici]MCP1243393.1 Ppx/GppA family phosphatase [Acetobacter lambici]MCP1259392.1 Ppx/GppA family phosphatase [Acetobacter lambici]NHO57664.1 Ppx/GppA family phosphatase [Acetobacter lambici]